MTLDEIKAEERQIADDERALDERRKALWAKKVEFGNKMFAEKGIRIGGKVMFYWTRFGAEKSAGPFIFNGYECSRYGIASPTFLQIKKDGTASARAASMPYNADVAPYAED